MLPAGPRASTRSPRRRSPRPRRGLPRSYWDWAPIVEANESGFWPYTSATNLLYGLREALAMLREEGLENVFARHAPPRRRHPRRRSSAWGLEVLCADEREHSRLADRGAARPEHDADEVRRVILERFDMSLGAGLGKLAGPGVPDRPPRRLQRPDARRHAVRRGDGPADRGRAADRRSSPASERRRSELLEAASEPAA